MTAFVAIVACLCVIRAVIRLGYLCRDYYPRVEHVDIWQDIVGMLASLGWVVWAAILLYTQ